MGILSRLRSKKIDRSREREMFRDIEENRLTKLEAKERRELAQETSLSNKRNEILKIREEKRKINPSFFDKLTRGNSQSKKPMYKSAWDETKKQGKETFNLLGTEGFASGFENTMSSSIWGNQPRQSQGHSRPIYIKKGKKFIKVKGKRHKHSRHQRHESRGYDPIWGRGF